MCSAHVRIKKNPQYSFILMWLIIKLDTINLFLIQIYCMFLLQNFNVLPDHYPPGWCQNVFMVVFYWKFYTTRLLLFCGCRAVFSDCLETKLLQNNHLWQQSQKHKWLIESIRTQRQKHATGAWSPQMHEFGANRKETDATGAKYGKTHVKRHGELNVPTCWATMLERLARA